MPEMLAAEQAVVRAYAFGRFREHIESAQNVTTLINLLLVLLPRESRLRERMIWCIEKMGQGLMNLGSPVQVTEDNYIDCIAVILMKVVSKSKHYLLRAAFADLLLKAYGWHDLKGFLFLSPLSAKNKPSVVGIQWPPRPGRHTQTNGDLQEVLIEDVVPIRGGGLQWSYYQAFGPRIKFCGREIQRYESIEESKLKPYFQYFKN
jgi:hypothetical protein